jgi:TonB-linked SusC/RagA family outer membrane protein
MYKFYTHKLGVLFWRALSSFQNFNTKLFLFAGLLLVSSATKAQRITLKLNNASIESVFKEIRVQSGYDVFFDRSLIQNSKPVDLNLNKVSLEQALISTLRNEPLTFTIESKTVIIKAKASVSNKRVQNQSPTIEIEGKVTDTTGRELIGATIKVSDRNDVVVTDNTGRFLIRAFQGDQLVISYIGYESVSISIGEKSGFQNIVLQSVQSKLSEVNVVSTGYQSIPRERATGSFSQPIKAMYSDRVSTDIISRLNGITSGLIFNSNTALAQNGQLDINIRGRSTIFANDQPLIVVDNFPFNGDINNINPSDVEGITVLKDAAAASIWGVRAGNGVIVVTTKKGKLVQPLKISFNSSLTLFKKPNLTYNPNQISSSDYIGLETYLFKQGYYDADLNDQTTFPVISPAVELLSAQRSGTISESTLNTGLSALKNSNVKDQIRKHLLNNGKNQQYGLNFSGGSNKATYLFSSGYDYNLPSAKENSYQRITLNSQNTFRPIASLEINIGLNVVQTKNRSDNTLNNTLNRVFPYSNIVDESGKPVPIAYNYRDSYVQSAPKNGFLDWSYSPLKELGASNNATTNNYTRITSGLKYTFIEGLTGELKYQFERTNAQNRNFQDQNTYYTRNLINQYSILNNGKVNGYNIPLGGILGLSNTNSIANNIRGQLNYNRSWYNSTVAAIVGVEFSEVRSSNYASTLYGYNDDNATFVNVNTTSFYNLNPSGNTATISSGANVGGGLDRIRSSFANLSYTYQGKYTLSGSARIDGSNYFGVATNQKSLPLWSTGAKWDISKENFYKVDWLPNLDFRATYGYNGNLDRSITGVTTLFYQSNALYTNLPYATIVNVGNPDLRWEKTGIANIGVDFSFRKSIISGSIEFYYKKETDILGYKTFPNNAGIISLEGNYSDMAGHGLDLTLTSRNINTSFKWLTTFMLSHATDKVTRYDVDPLATQLVGSDGNGTVAVPNVGKPVFGLYSYRWAGLNPSTGNPIGYLKGVPSEDYDAILNGSSIADLVYSGSARPTFFGGLNNRFSYKGFDLNVQINYKLGYYFRKPTINYSQITSNGSAYLTVNNDYINRWTKSGDEQHTNVPSMIFPFSSTRDQFYQGADLNVEKGDHIRLQDISFSYNFTKSAYPRLPFSALQLFIYANNIGILWKANHVGLDPDAIPVGNDRSTIPNPRSLALGIKGNF